MLKVFINIIMRHYLDRVKFTSATVLRNKLGRESIISMKLNFSHLKEHLTKSREQTSAPRKGI